MIVSEAYIVSYNHNIYFGLMLLYWYLRRINNEAFDEVDGSLLEWIKTTQGTILPVHHYYTSIYHVYAIIIPLQCRELKLINI